MSDLLTVNDSKTLESVKMHYCPGCGHISIHRLLSQVIDELGMRERTVFIAPVGCAVLAYNYLNVDGCEAAHGRAAAVATGVKRSLPDRIVISYQGDGDLAAIGMAETIHAANRGERITVIFVNNAIYGMTGGQMAPTTLIGQKSTTSQTGRDPDSVGGPIDMCKLLSTLEAPVLIARTKVTNKVSFDQTKMYIKKALEIQNEGKGYSFIEVLSNCNTNWKMSVTDANKWIDDVMEKVFPCKVYTDKYGVLK